MISLLVNPFIWVFFDVPDSPLLSKFYRLPCETVMYNQEKWGWGQEKGIETAKSK